MKPLRNDNHYVVPLVVLMSPRCRRTEKSRTENIHSSPKSISTQPEPGVCGLPVFRNRKLVIMNGNLGMNVVHMGMNMNMGGLNNNPQAMAALMQNQGPALGQSMGQALVQGLVQGHNQGLQAQGQGFQAQNQPPGLGQQIPGQGQQLQPQGQVPGGPGGPAPPQGVPPGIFNQNPGIQYGLNPNGMNGMPQLNHQQIFAQQQQMQQAAAQAAAAQQQGRPGIQRGVVLVNSAPGNATSGKTQYNPNLMGSNSAPNTGALPSKSAANSLDHTPQMASQPQPTFNGQPHQQFVQIKQPPNNKLNGSGNILNTVTPVMPQQPTPQSQPRAGPNPQQANMQSLPGSQQGPAPQLVPQGQQDQRKSIQGHVSSPLQKQPLIGANGNVLMIKSQEQMQLQNELNARILKRNMGNSAVVRVLDMVEQVSNDSRELLSTLEYWHRIAGAFFVPSAILRFTTASTSPAANFSDILNNSPKNPSNNSSNLSDPKIVPQCPLFGMESLSNGQSQQYELNTVTAPRFFVANIVAGNVANFNLTLPGIKFQVMNNGSVFVVSRINMHYIYSDGSVSDVSGNIKILMNRELRIEWIDCHCLNYQGSLSFGGLNSKMKAFTQTNLMQGNLKDFFGHLCDSSMAIESTATSGIHDSAMRIMKVGDVMCQLRLLMGFAMVNQIASPVSAMELFLSANNSQQAASLAAHQALLAAAQSQNPTLINLQGKNSAGSPSPDEDSKNTLKKRRMSNVASSAASPMGMEPKRRK